MSKDTGYILISRSVFDSVLWNEKRIYSRAEALIDLMQLARYSDKEARQLIGGKLLTWKQGEIPASNRYLQERWKWSNTKVKQFLDFLVKEGEIKISQNAGQTVISVLSIKKDENSRHQKRQQKTGSNPLPESVSEEPNDSKNDTKNDAETTAKRQQNDETVIKGVIKEENKEENKGEREDTPAHDILLQKEFKEFEEWVKDNCPRVQQMQEPITDVQLRIIKKRYKAKETAPVLIAMHNRADLFKNVSAFHTLMKWMKNEKTGNPYEDSLNEARRNFKPTERFRVPELGITHKTTVEEENRRKLGFYDDPRGGCL